jgi:hypothetical protein
MIALLHRPANGIEDGFTVTNVRDVEKFEGRDLFHAGDFPNQDDSLEAMIKGRALRIEGYSPK